MQSTFTIQHPPPHDVVTFSFQCSVKVIQSGQVRSGQVPRHKLTEYLSLLLKLHTVNPNVVSNIILAYNFFRASLRGNKSTAAGKQCDIRFVTLN